MGLDTSHDCWHGSYGSFMVWRMAIAKAAGVPLALMQGFFDWEIDDDDRNHALALVGSNRFEIWMYGCVKACAGNVPIQWESLRPDVIHTLLHHSDCDGELLPEHHVALADRLEELIPALPSDWNGHAGWHEQRTRQFVAGLREAAKLGEPVDFH